MYEITIKGNTPAELFANLAQMAAANANAAPAAVPQVPVAPAPTAANPTAAQPPVATPAPVATAPSATSAPTSPAAFNPAPAAAPTPVPAAVPPTAPATAPAAVPTAAPTYTLDALARAGAALAQAGKMQEALALLAKYGVQTVNQLKPEQYGAFATELRALGAQI